MIQKEKLTKDKPSPQHIIQEMMEQSPQKKSHLTEVMTLKESIQNQNLIQNFNESNKYGDLLSKSLSEQNKVAFPWNQDSNSSKEQQCFGPKIGKIKIINQQNHHFLQSKGEISEEIPQISQNHLEKISIQSQSSDSNNFIDLKINLNENKAQLNYDLKNKNLTGQFVVNKKKSSEAILTANLQKVIKKDMFEVQPTQQLKLNQIQQYEFKGNCSQLNYTQKSSFSQKIRSKNNYEFESESFASQQNQYWEQQEEEEEESKLIKDNYQSSYSDSDDVSLQQDYFD